MNVFFLSNKRKLVSVIALGIIALSSFLYTQFVLNNILDKERAGVELWAKAIEYTNRDFYPETQQALEQMMSELSSNPNLTAGEVRKYRRTLENASTDLANAGLDFIATELIINDRFQIPSIVTDENGSVIIYKDIDEEDANAITIKQFAAFNPPITIPVLRADGSYTSTYVYYGQSAVAQSLKYFPYIQFGLLSLFLSLIYLNISTIRKTEQSNLWVGMAKEAAHQLGTPLSSMYGWIELLKDSTTSTASLNIVHELEEDVKRMQNVAERFNKIGSGPELSVQRVEPVLEKVVDYMEKRLPQFSKNIHIRRSFQDNLKATINTDLLSWAIENLIKNAIDAIDTSQENSFVEVRCHGDNHEIVIEIEDSGRGIDKKHFKEVFQPGFSTKKRGWGLGLSLTRRIIEEYHKGKISIVKSIPGEGTVFRITLPKKES